MPPLRLDVVEAPGAANSWGFVLLWSGHSGIGHPGAGRLAATRRIFSAFIARSRSRSSRSAAARRSMTSWTVGGRTRPRPHFTGHRPRAAART